MIDAEKLYALVGESFNVSLQPELFPDRELPETYVDWHILSGAIAALCQKKKITVLGISGSQGSGKSTLSRILAQRLNVDQPTETVSLDDFYLSSVERQNLARTIHPLLGARGVPGTHDWQWLQRTVEMLQGDTEQLLLPEFDKGLDDRVGERKVRLKQLILEGWCLGVQAQPDSRLLEPINELEAVEDAEGVWRRWVNEQIHNYQRSWDRVDFWIHLRVPGFEQVYEWRAEAEQKLPAEQRMSEHEVHRFIAHYERLTRWIWHVKPRQPGFVVHLDEDHNVQDISLVTT